VVRRAKRSLPDGPRARGAGPAQPVGDRHARLQRGDVAGRASHADAPGPGAFVGRAGYMLARLAPLTSYRDLEQECRAEGDDGPGGGLGPFIARAARDGRAGARDARARGDGTDRGGQGALRAAEEAGRVLFGRDPLAGRPRSVRLVRRGRGEHGLRSVRDPGDRAPGSGECVHGALACRSEQGGYWRSTRSTAPVVAALALYLAQHPKS